jgi:hypothetical protein
LGARWRKKASEDDLEVDEKALSHPTWRGIGGNTTNSNTAMLTVETSSNLSRPLSCLSPLVSPDDIHEASLIDGRSPRVGIPQQ